MVITNVVLTLAVQKETVAPGCVRVLQTPLPLA